MEGCCAKEQNATQGAGAHAPEDGDLCALAIGDAAGPGTAEKGGDVLNADDQTGERSVVTHPHVDVFWQDCEWEADGEIDDETKRGKANDLPGTAVGGHGGHGGHVVSWLNLHGLGWIGAVLVLSQYNGRSGLRFGYETFDLGNPAALARMV